MKSVVPGKVSPGRRTCIYLNKCLEKLLNKLIKSGGLGIGKNYLLGFHISTAMNPQRGVCPTYGTLLWKDVIVE